MEEVLGSAGVRRACCFGVRGTEVVDSVGGGGGGWGAALESVEGAVSESAFFAVVEKMRIGRVMGVALVNCGHG